MQKGARTLSAQTKDVVCNVFLYFAHQREVYLRTLNGDEVICGCSICLLVASAANPWAALPLRATELATNVRKRDVFRMGKRKGDSLQDFITPCYTSTPTIAERQQAREFLSHFYAQKKHRLHTLNSDGRRLQVLEYLGFGFRRWNDATVPIEKCSLVAKRARYLRSIQEARGHSTIFFLDVCWLNENRTVSFTLEDCKNPIAAILFAGSSTTDSAPVFQILSPHGDIRVVLRYWVCSLARNVTTRFVLVVTAFEWMTSPAENVPTDISSKLEMIQWLNRHSIPHDENSSRYELLELVTEHRNKFCTPELQTIIESAGHSVLFVPSNVLELNPVTRVWQYLEQSFKEEPTDIATLLGRIDKDIWHEFYLSFVAYEDAYRQADKVMFRAMERLLVNGDAYRDETLF